MHNPKPYEWIYKAIDGDLAHVTEDWIRRAFENARRIKMLYPAPPEPPVTADGLVERFRARQKERAAQEAREASSPGRSSGCWCWQKTIRYFDDGGISWGWERKQIR